MPENIDVVLGFDRSYELPASVAIGSLAANSAESVRIRLHIFHEGLSTDVQASLASRTRHQDDVIFYHVDGSASFDDRFRHSSAYLNGSAMLRLHVDELPGWVERVVYLDGDVLVRGDVSELWRTDLGGHSVGAVEDPFLLGRGGLIRQLARELLADSDRPSTSVVMEDGSEPAYFNSGVMVIDLEEWRARRISDRARELVSLAGGYSQFPDQDSLNMLMMSEWQSLPARWNTIVPSWKYENLPRNEIQALLDEAALLHYAGNVKPWTREYPDSWLGRVYRDQSAALGIGLPDLEPVS